MKRILFLITCIIALSSCHFNQDTVVKSTNDSIYVSQINMFTGNERIKAYSQPKKYKGVVVHKRYAGKPRKRYVKVKVGNRHLYIKRYEGKGINSSTMQKFNIGDTVNIRETFYPFHRRELIK